VATSVKAVVEAFELLYTSLHSREYRKSLNLHECGERELLPIVRCFLLGYFGKITPELARQLPGTSTGTGRIDFCVDGVAVEFAVRKPLGSKSKLSAVTNSTELKKLLKYDGKALLVLFDFSKDHFSDEELERFRDLPSLGHGNHKYSAFNVAYFYVKSVKPSKSLGCIRKTIRVK
jgi:hypothetical protein